MREVLGFWIAAYEFAYESAYKSSFINQKREIGHEWAEDEVPDEVLLNIRSAVGMGDGSVIPTSKADRKNN